MGSRRKWSKSIWHRPSTRPPSGVGPTPATPRATNESGYSAAGSSRTTGPRQSSTSIGRVELEFLTLCNARDLITGVSFYDAMGTCLFASCDWRPTRLPPSRYLKHVEIPARFLAEGRVNILVQLVFYDPDIRSVVEPDVMAFDAADSDHPLAVRGHYKGTWPGLVRPGLPWGEAQALAEPAGATSIGGVR